MIIYRWSSCTGPACEIKRRVPLSRLPLSGRILPLISCAAHYVKVGGYGGHLLRSPWTMISIHAPRTTAMGGCITAPRRVTSRCAKSQRLHTTPISEPTYKQYLIWFFKLPICWAPHASPPVRSRIGLRGPAWAATSWVFFLVWLRARSWPPEAAGSAGGFGPARGSKH